MQPLLLISFTFLIFSSMSTLDAGDVPDEAVQSWRNILRRAETGSIQVSNAQWTNGNLKFENGLLLTQRDGVNIVHERGPLGAAGREGVRPPRVSIRTESAYYGLEKPSEDADWKLVFAEPSEETEDGIVRRIAIYEANLFRSVFVFSGDLATLYDQPNRYEFSAWKIDDLPGPQLGTFQIKNLSDDNQFELLKVQVNPAHQYRVEQIDFEWSDESAPSTIKLKYGPEFDETIPKSIETRFGINGSRENVRGESETLAHSFEAPPAEVFTLEHYGVPDVGLASGGGWSFTAMLIGIAVIFLIGALFFAYRQQRKQDAAGAKIATNSNGSKGFTLVELLVAISIISILLALGIPAVQSAREASRKNTCLNHGRQIGLAAQLHHAAFRSLPSNGGFTEDSMIADINGQPTYVSTESFSTGSASRWGIGAPGLSPKVQSGCWAYALLPFLEQQAAYETVSVHTNQPIYTCVSRPSRPTLSPAEDQFGRYVTGNIPWARTDFAANRKVVSNRPRVTEIPHIRDGTSHTIFAGEKSIDPVLHGTGSWYFDEPLFTGGSHGTARDGNRVIQDRVGTAAILNWGSTHPGSAVFVMIDGSTHSVGYSIDRELMSALLDPNDGKTKSLSDYFGH